MSSNTVLTVLLVAIVAILVASVISSYLIVRNNNKGHRRDPGLSETTAKHPWLANPILISYVVFHVLFLIIALVVVYILL